MVITLEEEDFVTDFPAIRRRALMGALGVSAALPWLGQVTPAQAAAKLWWLIGAAQLLGATGVALKDESQGLLPG